MTETDFQSLMDQVRQAIDVAEGQVAGKHKAMVGREPINYNDKGFFCRCCRKQVRFLDRYCSSCGDLMNWTAIISELEKEREGKNA